MCTHLPFAVDFLHFVGATNVKYEREIRNVVASPIRPVDQMSGQVVVHHISGHLFQNVKHVFVRKWTTPTKGRVVDDHPLVIVRATVVKFEYVYPAVWTRS